MKANEPLFGGAIYHEHGIDLATDTKRLIDNARSKLGAGVRIEIRHGSRLDFEGLAWVRRPRFDNDPTWHEFVAKTPDDIVSINGCDVVARLTT